MTADATSDAPNAGRPTVLIVGGGLAGLSAAAALGTRGCAVTVLESRPRLGGRASSFLDKTTGQRVDNCQHVAMGCCTNFLHLCETAGLSGLLSEQGELTFLLPDGTVSRLSEHRPFGRTLPAPLHLALSFARLAHFTAGEKRRLAAGVTALARGRGGGDEDFQSWLDAHGQTDRLVARFWHPVLVSALSEVPGRMSVAGARKVIADGFLAHPAAWRVFVPTVPLDVLYGERLPGWLRSNGVRVETGAGVRSIAPGSPGAVRPRVTLRDGTERTADHVVLAVPQDRAAGLVPEDFAGAAGLSAAATLETAAISSVHIWYGSEITPLPHAVLPERTSQWVFNRTRLHRRGEPEARASAVGAAEGDALPKLALRAHDGSHGHYYQVVISASDALKSRPSAEVVEEVLAELRDAFPAARGAVVRHARMVTEHRAVFAPLPGHERLRPASRTPHPRVHLAGDYTRTGWPATMEGAVRSGYAAAESVLESLGRPETVVRPDLKAGRLGRWLGFA